MLIIHPVYVEFEPTREHPLYIGNFFNLRRMWWKKRKQRQQLIFAIAIAWRNFCKSNNNVAGLLREEIALSYLYKYTADAKIILEKFFKIEKLGYKFSNSNKSCTIISAKKLPKEIINAIDDIYSNAEFDPSEEPLFANYICTKIKIFNINKQKILNKLTNENKFHLIAPVKWLLKQNTEINFYYRPSGNLQARDTSVWPIKAVETWPRWLREELFGRAIDIENAFCQFLVLNLFKKYEKNKRLLELKYPDLLRSIFDKDNFRNEICKDILKLPITNENIKVVKQILMALANGSNISPQIILSKSKYSTVCRTIYETNPNLGIKELIQIGERLAYISKQFKSAKRALCIFLLNDRPTIQNQQRIFKLYFEWERQTRYKIWQIVGNTGLHLHDGLDGIISNQTDEQLISEVYKNIGIRVSIDNPQLEII